MTSVVTRNPPRFFESQALPQKVVDFGFNAHSTYDTASRINNKGFADGLVSITGHHDMTIIVDDMSNYPQIQSIAYHGQQDRSSDDGDSTGAQPDPTDLTSNLRGSLKIVRDPSKTAYDFLPNGETLGAFANRHAVDRYSRKVESKRERARETRRRKRKAGIIYPREKKRRTQPPRSSRNVPIISHPGKGL